MFNFKYIAIIILALLMSAAAHAGALGTAFTYQGELNQSGMQVSGDCDFNFGLWDAAAGGVMVGDADLFNVPVNNGIFTVELDFGAGAFSGEERWIEIAVVCPAGGGLTTLTPRQKLTATPNALFALEAGSMEFANLNNVPAGLADGDDVDDADADPTNEIQDLELMGKTLTLTGDASPVDLSGLVVDTDDQNLAEVLAQGNDAGGTTITNLPAPVAGSEAATMAYVDGHSDADSDPANELQNLFATIDGDTGSTTADEQADSLSVVGGGSVSTEITGDTLTISSSGISGEVGDPVVVGTLGIGAEPQSVYVSGRYAYVADSDSNDLKIIDVSDPGNPTLTGSLAIGTTTQRVFVAGRYAYVVDQGTHDMRVIDVSDPSSPVQAGSVGTGGQPFSLYVSGRYAYVISFGSKDLEVIDVSDPSAPSVAGTADLGVDSGPQAVFVFGRYAYIADSGLDELRVFDVSDPGNPGLVGSLGVGTFPRAVYVSGRYAYLMDRGSEELMVIDVSDPANPMLVGSLGGFIGDPKSIHVAGSYAYVIDDFAGDFKVVDVSDPVNPTLVGSLDMLGNPASVYVAGRYAYVVSADSNEFQVIDVSGVELASLIAHSLEAGNMQVRNDVIAQGQLQVTGGVNVGTGGVFSDGNVGLSGTLAIANDVAPTASPANVVQLYAEDEMDSSELKVRDEAGNVTTLSPHNFSLIGEPSEPMAWSYFSENEHGRINVDMLRTVRLVEAMSGQELVHIEPNGSVDGALFSNSNQHDFEAAGRTAEDYAASYRELKTTVQALQAQKDAEITQLKAENQAMRDRLEALESKLN